ncbi:MAG: iron ABC transporter permease [Alcanivoracaceae bacterium]|nr:iron ABC transporter permease [Alcanivoracaceae bacterium]
MEREVSRPPVVLMLSGLLLLLLVATVMALRVGPVAIGSVDVWQALWRSDGSLQSMVVRELRLPRMILAALVGSALALSGAILQGLFRNPLADPGLIGVSSGAALGAVSVIVMASWWLNPVPVWLLPMMAFVGALLATLVVWRIATRQSATDVSLLLLAGIAINALVMALTGLLVFAADDAQLRELTFWNLGSVAQATAEQIAVTLPCLILVWLTIPWLARPLNALLLGEAVAGHLGFSVERVKRVAIFSVALSVGAAVSVSGLIGFVGLVAPHLVRLTLGADHRLLLPASALLGAVLLITADTIARTIVAPAELPIGLVMALMGGPFFLFLLMQRRR